MEVNKGTGGMVLKADFFDHYHYKTELAALCREYHLAASGTKAELNQRLRAAMLGEPPETPTRTSAPTDKVNLGAITLTTPLAGSGFAFNAAARRFFAAYFKTSKFAFTKPMAVVKRQAESRPELGLTVADLVAVYQATQTPSARKQFLAHNVEEQTYEWNRFVRDFFADHATVVFSSRLKVAAILWKNVKRSMTPKRCTHQLLSRYREEIARYKL